MNELSPLSASLVVKPPLLKHLFGGFFWGAFIIAILLWGLDAWVEFSAGHYDSFMDGLVNPDDHDMEHRAITTVTFLLLGIAASAFVGRLNETRLKLQESHAWLNIMSDASFEGLVISENGIIIAANKQICSRSGYSQEELVGRSVLEMAGPENCKELERQIGGRLEDPYIITAKRKNGEKIVVEVRTRNLNIDGRNLRVSALLDITERQETESNLRNYERRLRTMTTRVALAEEKVRRDIAIALHDSVAQQLSIARLKLGSVLQDTSDEESADPLSEISELIDGAIGETRTLVFDLSPPVLYELGFVAAVEWLGDMLSERHGIECKVKVIGGELLLDHDLRVTMYQLVRELLINVTKHSGAESATVSITDNGGMLSVEVTDNGCGFSESSVGPGFGLFSIRERLKPLDGELIIDSKPGQGSTVGICMPLGQRGESDAP